MNIRRPRTRRTLRRWRGPAAGLLSALVLAACAGGDPLLFGGVPSALSPKGPAAASISGLWWVMFGLGTAIFLFVMGLLLWGLFRPRARPPEGDWRTQLSGHERGALPGRPTHWIVGGGIVMPAVVIGVLLALMLGTQRAIKGTAAEASGDVVIDVIGRQWWWEIRYPNQGFETANEIHIPAGQPILVRLTSDDVIHSFWVPELHGKLDLVPDRTTTLVLQADQPGEYRGECAEFCGVQHARMGLLVVADTPEAFRTWLERQAQDARPPRGPLEVQGQQVFLGSACVYCHRVAGTNATGDIGPDLTHLASRRTLGAATAPNTRGHLAGWIIDPHGLKPGNLMPPTNLSAEELQALLVYLESLD